ncbi:hypothetical protein HIM_12461 [Hirsutella minnesotensis 3608]|uniref:Uncharacterized protein n=1 Tax=Hirsutella minnesotensis 3608 TaxID=1043627 RepID=A0A0F7ZW08_9HYPO|nr:hypothetical protein HIM_12461 [Hirsutella minnesotensis 3608]
MKLFTILAMASATAIAVSPPYYNRVTCKNEDEICNGSVGPGHGASCCDGLECKPHHPHLPGGSGTCTRPHRDDYSDGNKGGDDNDAPSGGYRRSLPL